MSARIELFVVQIVVLTLFLLTIPTGPFFAETPDPSGEAKRDLPLRITLERKETHLALGWHTLSESLKTRSTGSELVLHARQALLEGPANGYAWLQLAWGRWLEGRQQDSLAALRRSWALAPQSRNLAWLRAVLGTQHWPDLAVEDRARLASDMRRARDQNADPFRSRLQTHPRFQAVWRITRHLSRAQT